MSSRVTKTFTIGHFQTAAQAWLDEPDARPEPVEPAQAATVMLVRGAPVEVFMIERAATMAFAPSTWVFPGGRVDPSDAEFASLQALTTSASDGSQTDAEWGHRMGCTPEEGRTLTVAVLRELFEEAGVLLASAQDSEDVVSVGGPEWAQRRKALEAHEVSLAEVAAGLTLRGDLVAAVDRWITPEFERRRYDTWFFVALLPEGSRAQADTREAQQGRWVDPAQMLAAADAGEIKLLPPTRTSLERLARSPSSAVALAAARSSRFEPTCPTVHAGPDGLYLQADVNL